MQVHRAVVSAFMYGNKAVAVQCSAVSQGRGTDSTYRWRLKSSACGTGSSYQIDLAATWEEVARKLQCIKKSVIV